MYVNKKKKKKIKVFDLIGQRSGREWGAPNPETRVGRRAGTHGTREAANRALGCVCFP